MAELDHYYWLGEHTDKRRAIILAVGDHPLLLPIKIPWLLVTSKLVVRIF